MIDWFTIAAQALNFLILIWLMKRFLYQPILRAIDERENRIAKELADADAARNEAQKERDGFQQRNAKFDEQRAALLSKATDEAKGERQRLLAEARKAADALSATREEMLKQEHRDLTDEFSRRTQEEVFAIARKVLTDLADAGLEERMSHVFTQRLRELSDKPKARLAGALKSSSEPAIVRSAFDLPADARAAIQKALNETFTADIAFRFERATDLVCGIELSVNGQKVAWSIADFLASLEASLGQLLAGKGNFEKSRFVAENP